MYKSVLRFVIFAALTCSSSIFAQSIFNYGATIKPGKPPAPAMTPDDFKSTVNSLNKQTKNGITQQLNQQYQTSAAPVPPSTSLNTGNLTTGNPNNTAASSSTQTNVETSVTNPPPASPFAPPPTEEGAYPPTDFYSSKPAAGSSPQSYPGRAPTTSSQQGQVYTGFGAGNTTTPSNRSTTNSSSGSNSGGWNIKY